MRVRQNVRATEHLPDRATPSHASHTDINHHNIHLTTTTVHLLRPPRSHSTSPPWIIAETTSQLRNPLTLKPHIWNRPTNFILSKFNPTTLAVSYHSSSSFDKLLFFPQPKSSNPNYDKSTLFALNNGGELSVLQKDGWWRLSLGVDKFDDIVIFKGKVYVLDREGKLNVVNIYKKSRKVSIGKTLISSSITPGAGRFGWRKRVVVDGNEMYLVVRKEELFEVYKMVRRGKAVDWSKVEGFDGRKVLFMTRDYCFLRRAEKRFPGREYKNCIVFTEGAFPMYGNRCWEFTQGGDDDDDVAVFRLGDGRFGWEGESVEFPWINWLPPWIFRASDLVDEFQSRSLSESYSQSESEPNENEGLDANSRDEKDEEEQSDLKDSNSKDEIDVQMPSIVNIESDSDSQNKMDGRKKCYLKESDSKNVKDSNSKDVNNGQMPSIVNIESDSDSQDKVDGRMKCSMKDPDSKNVKDSNSKDVKDGQMQKEMKSDSGTQDEKNGQMQCDSNSQEKDDEEMISTVNIECAASLQEDVSPSLFGPESEATHIVSVSLSAADEEVTRTLLSMNGGNDATEQETSRTNISHSVLGACSSSTTKSHKSDSTVAKFEGFDIRSDLVPTLQKIWLKHGNIIENSIIRSGDIIGKALESLATMVRILEENTAESLSGSQVDYLNSTLSDLRCICFKVYWVIPFVDKAVQLHKSKPLLDSLNNLSQLSSQIKERRAIVFNELAKLGVEENKLKEEMAMVSNMIPVSGQYNLDEPLGLGLA